MLTHLRLTSVVAGLLLSACVVRAEGPEGVARVGTPQSGSDEGIVRVSGDSQATVYRGQSVEYCPEYYGYGGCRFWNHGRMPGYFADQASIYRMRNMAASQSLNAAIAADFYEKGRWARCKFGYFVPTGCGGAGCPPFGVYRMVYPADPSYFDGRDGQVYAAQGYGGPVSVPLAPNVFHTYNYGWGVPSSRLTPVAHPTY